MTRVPGRLRRLLRWGAYLGVLLVLVGAIAVTVLRLWLPTLGERKDELEQFLSQHSTVPVRIERLEVYWEGLSPRVRAGGVSLLAASGGPAVASLDELRLRLALLPLLTGDFVFDELTVVRPVLQGVRLGDGRIVLAEMVGAEGDDGGGQGRALLHWLLQQSEVRVERGRFVWIDQRAGEAPLAIDDINLYLRNSGERHQFGGTASLPRAICTDLSFRADIRSDGVPFLDADMDGRVYLHALDLDLDAFPAVLREAMPANTHGRVSTQVWSEWSGGTLEGVEGFLGVQNLVYGLPWLKEPLRVARGEGNVTWHSTEDNFKLVLEGLSVQLDDHPWPVGKVVIEHDAGREHTRVAMQRLQVREMSGLIDRLRDPPARLLSVPLLAPRGEVSDLTLELEGPWSAPHLGSLRARIDGASWQPYESLPGVNGLSGNLQMDTSGGEFVLDARSGSVELPGLFEAPIAVERAQGRMTWQRDADGLRLQGANISARNSDAAVSGNLELFVPGDKERSPEIRLRFDLADGAGSQHLRYFPSRRWPHGLVDWLRAAQIEGHVGRAHVRLEGPLRRFPFVDGEGVFEVEASVHDGALNFARGWPRATGLEAVLRFDRAAMEITANAGQLHGMDIKSVEARIENLRDPEKSVQVRGNASGPFGEVVEFLRAGPVLHDGRHVLSGMTGAGAGALTVSLNIPVRHPAETTVAGRYEFLDSELSVRDALRFTRLKGVLDFTENQFTASGVTAFALGGEATLDVSTPQPGRQALVYIDGRGRADVRELAPLVGEDIIAPLGGTTGWKGRLALQKGRGRLEIESDLRGVTSRYPPPLDKPADAAFALQVTESYGEGADITTHLEIGGRLHGVLVSHRKGAQRYLTAGEILVGKGTAATPGASGLVLRFAGEQFDADRWFAHYRRKDGSAAEIPPILRRIEVAANRVQLFDRPFRDVNVQLARAAGGSWSGTIAAAEARGAITVLWDADPRQVSLELERLHLPAAARPATPDTRSRPGEIPRLLLRTPEFAYGSVALGALDLDAAPRGEVYEIRTLRIAGKDYTIDGSGAWAGGSNRRSEVNLRFKTSDLGSALGAMGFPGHVARGDANVEARLEWPGDPADFALGQLDGRIQLDARKGSFLGLDTGAGRFLGLFNVDAVARRLTLDFTDIFNKGYAFDRITGKIDIAQGYAYTSGLLLAGPAADIEISGRSALLERRHDMRLQVTPELGANLAVATGVGAGPAAGAAVYLLQKLLKRPLANIVRYSYTVTGPWAEPTVQRVARDAPG